MTLEDTLRHFAGDAVRADLTSAPLTKLKGDASNRSYYRIGSTPSYVLMVMPREATRSEEMTSGEPPGELPFVNVHRYLERIGVRVPAILRYDALAGLMILEDLTDETFERAQSLSSEARERCYGRAVDLLARTRARAEKSPDPECLAFTRSFDAELFDWELHHFREFGLEARTGRTLSPAERTRLDRLFRDLAERLAFEPKGFTHRDYQSRNLMVKGEELVVIDFQDALLGPRQYDLVALLRDSYVELDRPFIERMLDRYLTTFASSGGERLDRTRFIEVFDLLTLQRKLKDAGRFEFIDRVKKNPSFLPYVAPSLGYVRSAFERLPKEAELRALLAAHVPELRQGPLPGTR
jgi:aminoglycoside/choline kinase family phosphotransferase